MVPKSLLSRGDTTTLGCSRCSKQHPDVITLAAAVRPLSLSWSQSLSPQQLLGQVWAAGETLHSVWGISKKNSKTSSNQDRLEIITCVLYFP